MNEENYSQQGLSPVRTSRVIATIIALVGMMIIFIQRVLSAVLEMAREGVDMGLARYNNFTGRIAAQNFAEDKELLSLLKDVQNLLPVADSALAILSVFAGVLLIVSLIGFAFPRPFIHCLVAAKILKWGTEQEDSAGAGTPISIKDAMKSLGNVPLKKLAVPVGAILVVLLLGVGISNCHDKATANSAEFAIEDMQEKALSYIQAQKSYFAKKKAVGSAGAISMKDATSTDAFEINISATRFTATSKIPLGECPAGSRWQISAGTKGFFSVELTLHRSVPKDANCAKLTPGFKDLGRK